ncbi:B3 domain-containing protein At5g42700-like [Andrographis paniculata]|uniref:B3 domain-containing protein At5g42700-like n=1 Tax=Andrographis paniculata TaxID=175694 RepID=UPI0021E8F14D|nr:B3 domain-containing protein At5g42700-like [Andrographis paniculata]
MASGKLLHHTLREKEEENAPELLGKDPTYHPRSEKVNKVKKRRNAMELGRKKKRVSKKSRGPKSKDAQVRTDDSKPPRVARKRRRTYDLFEDMEAESSVKARARQVLDHLGYELPHFTKCMLPSNVSHGFWLHLPKKFCITHFPICDTCITLEDEWGNEYETSYLLDRYGLSAGWRRFSITHRLLKGDILIFHLIAPCKLKVHVVRVHGTEVVSAALSLLDISASGRRTDGAVRVKKGSRKRRKPQFVEPFLLESPEPLLRGTIEGSRTTISDTNAHQPEGISSKAAEGNEPRNQPKPCNNICCPQTSFLCDHTGKGVTCM